MNSILIYVKKKLGINQDDTYFDDDIIGYINSVLTTINQLGVGPSTGFIITGIDEKWTDLIGERKDIEIVKTLIYMKVRLIFDPPTNNNVLESVERQITEMEWRLNQQMEGGI